MGHEGDDDCWDGSPIKISFDSRFFSGDEEKTYLNVRAIYALPKLQDSNVHFNVQFLGTFSSKSDTDISDGETLAHGGNDYEFRLSAAGNATGGRYSAFIGVAFPDTPAQDKSANLTFGGKESWNIWPGGSVYVNPRGVLIPNNTLLGIGMGLDERIQKGLMFGGEITPLINGENTRSTNDGTFERQIVWDAHVRYRLVHNWSISAGVTNALGVTTGMSLTPGLGSSVAPYVGIGGRF
jgi:hypothetical protein